MARKTGREKETSKLAGKQKPSKIRQFRSDVAKLKRAGLIHPGVDARRAELSSRSLRNAVRKFQNVIRGQAATIKLGRLSINQREALARNLQIAKPAGLPARVIVPHFPDERVRRGRGGTIQFDSPEGIRRLELPPVRTDTMGHFFSDLKRSTKKLPDQREGQFFAARFFNGRTQLFESLRDLLNTLNVYDSVVAAHGRKQTAEIVRNIEIFTVPESKTGVWQNLKAKRK